MSTASFLVLPVPPPAKRKRLEERPSADGLSEPQLQAPLPAPARTELDLCGRLSPRANNYVLALTAF